MVQTKQFEFEWIPAKTVSDRVIIVLHGREDTLKPFRHIQSELKLPNFHFLLINGPKKRSKGYIWATLSYNKNPLLEESVQRLSRLINDLITQGWSAKNIFLLGFSEGAMIASETVLQYPKKLGGILAISGCLFLGPLKNNSVSKSASKTPWLMTHGKRDRIIPLKETKTKANRLKSIGLPIDWVELPKGHAIEPEIESKVIRRWFSEKLLL